jgi:hypothetical protein
LHIEVFPLADTQNNALPQLISEARERFGLELRAYADQVQQLEQNLQELRDRQRQLEQSIERHFEELANVKIEAAPAPETSGAPVEALLAAVRELITATFPEQVLEVLTVEGQKLGVRTAVFDVRGKAAWGSSSAGFTGLSDKAVRSLIIPLTQENPFRACYEIGGHVDASAATLKKNRNILDKLRPDPEDPILLLPVRSAGSVSAIVYVDAGGTHKALPADALKILTEFAGAQLDRLMAFSGGMPAPAEVPAVEPEPAESESEAAVAEPEAEAVEAEVETVEAEPVAIASSAAAVGAAESIPQTEPLPVPGATVPVSEEPPPPRPPVEAAPPPPPPVVGVDVSQLSEEEQKAHRDAKRFAKLLVSEIELYNKAKVAEGRKNGDLYKRLKSDIDRSRQTYEKRFGKTVGKQHDYFHEELIRTLASNESSLLGSEYPGPTV